MPYQYSAVVTFDFHQNMNVGSFRVWNFNMVNGNGSYTGRGSKDVSIFTQADGGEWVDRGLYLFPEAPGLDSYTGNLFTDQEWQDVRYVRFDIHSIWGEGDTGGHTGLSEVQFYTPEETEPTVPEPATMFLLGSGLIGVLGLRRKTV
ncbi:MAG: PEP-CTERM sorting domain-containing protein [Candidatus Omnitrophica bacterium]|nr:PEP-CTERM sorting domain-containing protein [Candidatus Omnitrophota bacterium]